MKIKNKIRRGFGLIFIVILFFGALSVFFINQMSNGAKVILKNNYETLQYTREMRNVLDNNKLPLDKEAQHEFEVQLINQEHNITEKNEGGMTAIVRNSFETMRSPVAPLVQQEAAEVEARRYLRSIEIVNMNAIVQKTDEAQSSVNNAVLILGLAGCITFLFLFSFSVNIGRYLADPLIKLAEGLEEIGRKNYNYRLELSSDDEFGEVAGAFNQMAEKLKAYDNADMTELFAEKRRIEAIIGHINDGIIVLNEKQELVFINTVAQNLLNLHGPKLAGKPADQLMADHKLLRSVLESKDGSGIFKFEVDGREIPFRLESTEIFIPNITDLKLDELNIARISAGKVYQLRNLSELHQI
jgi:two-component system, NtrC family, sensor histidine kinase KinB